VARQVGGQGRVVGVVVGDQDRRHTLALQRLQQGRQMRLIRRPRIDHGDLA